jgi:hypothetical protein
MGIAQNASIMYRDAITLFLYLLILNSVWQTQLMRNDFKEHELMNDNWEISTTTIQKVTTTMSAVITMTFYEIVGHKSIRPSSLTFITNSSEMITNPSPNDQKVSISSTHFTIHHHHHHHHRHRFSVHQQKFARIVFLARPCMTDRFALSASMSSDSHVSRNWVWGGLHVSATI